MTKIPDPPDSQPIQSSYVTMVLTVGIDVSTVATIGAAARSERVSRVESVGSLDDARQFVDSVDSPVIVVIDRAEMEKALAFPERVHVIVVAGPTESGEGMLGVDEVLHRPLRIDDLRNRLRIANRLLCHRRANAAEVLLQALATGLSGEVIVSNGENSARVHVEEGRVVWVHRSQNAVSVRHLLAQAGATVDDQTVRDILDESRSARRHFADTVVAWNIAPADAFRETLRQHLKGELGVVLGLNGASATFVADNRPTNTQVSFSGSELGLRLRSMPRTSTIQNLPHVKVVDDRLAEEWLQKIHSIEHVMGCALVDPKIGRVMGSLGFDGSEMTMVWEMARAFTAMGETADEVLATARERAFLVRAVSGTKRLVAVVRFDATRLSPAMARILLSRVTAAGLATSNVGGMGSREP